MASIDPLPPPDPHSALRLGLVGGAGMAVASALGLALGESVDSYANTVRLLLVAGGAIAVALSMIRRPDLPKIWAVATAGWVLAGFGLPEHWDSAIMLSHVIAAFSLVGSVLVAVPAKVRYSLISLAFVFHFGGIFTATTWPSPTPWLTNQVGYRIYQPYLTFLYLRNAYHFYSPEPGPASHLFVLLKYELDEIDPKTGKPKQIAEWITLPRRDEHMKDPMGQSYYRRLSITEMVSNASPPVGATGFESLDVYKRRQNVAVVPVPGMTEPIPFLNSESAAIQYKVPQANITRYLLPSYARHLAALYSEPGRKVVSLKIYRVEHRIVPPNEFAAGTNPYHPLTYRPYYYGEYLPDGTLVNPQDPMLYWLLPIMPRPGGASPTDPDPKDYVDFMSKHAGYELDWRRMRP